MAAFTSEEIIQATGARLLKPAASVSFSDVCTDTRAIAKGSLFVAFKGTSFNGHDFVDKALAAGAAGAVVSEVRPEYEGLTAPIFVAADTLKAYQDLARFHRRRFAIPVVAVTGSVGKTSTRNMIATVLSEKYRVLQTEKNFNNEIGLPKTLLQLTPDHEACVVEMGMRGLGQIAELAAIGEPTIGVVTNVGKSHIELLGSQENIAKAKAELVQALDEKGTAVLNGDDPFVRPMTALCKGKTVLYGTDDQAAVRADHIVCDQQGAGPVGRVGIALHLDPDPEDGQQAHRPQAHPPGPGGPVHAREAGEDDERAGQEMDGDAQYFDGGEIHNRFPGQGDAPDYPRNGSWTRPMGRSGGWLARRDDAACRGLQGGATKSDARLSVPAGV